MIKSISFFVICLSSICTFTFESHSPTELPFKPFIKDVKKEGIPPTIELLPIQTIEMFSSVINPFTTGYHPRTIAVFDIDDTVGIPTGPIITSGEAFADNQFVIQHFFHGKPEEEIYGKKIEELLKAQEKSTLKPLDEENTVSKKIKALQENQIIVIGLTARSTPLRDVTLKQLKRLKIEFNDISKGRILHISGPSKQTAIFSHGILFCGDNAKGPMLKNLLKSLEIDPLQIIYADDSQSNVESVIKLFPGKVLPLFMQIVSRKPGGYKIIDRSPTIPTDHEYIIIGDRKISRRNLFSFLLAVIEGSDMRPYDSMRDLRLGESYHSDSSDGTPLGSPTMGPQTCHPKMESNPFEDS